MRLFDGLVILSIALCLAYCLTGCSSTMGKITPMEFTSAAGETIVACEVDGWTIAVGDGGVCRTDDEGQLSTTEGGRVSETFRDLTLGVIESAGRIAAGVLGGVGGAISGVGGAVSPDSTE